jgi:hypothetical protein
VSQTVALFHSVLWIREGIAEAAARLRGNGHHVVVVDQYDGRTFDDYEEVAPLPEVQPLTRVDSPVQTPRVQAAASSTGASHDCHERRAERIEHLR